MDYLVDGIVGGQRSLSDTQGFVWDRTKSIRQELIIQSSWIKTRVDQLHNSIYCLEHCVRYHAISLHWQANSANAATNYEENLDLQQLQASLKSLEGAYADLRAQGGFSENEDEFRAMWIVFHL